MTSLAVGFAIAAKPVWAQVINTATNGIKVAEVKVPVADGEIATYQAMPLKGKTSSDLSDSRNFWHTRTYQGCVSSICKIRLFGDCAKMFARQGDVSAMTDIGEILTKVVSKVPDQQVMAGLDATLAFVTKLKPYSSPSAFLNPQRLRLFMYE